MKESQPIQDRQQSRANAYSSLSEGLEQEAVLSPPAFSIAAPPPIQRQVGGQLDVAVLIERIQNMRDLVSSIRGAADNLREAGTHWYGDEADMMAEAENLAAMASSISNAADQLDQIVGTAGEDRIFEGTTTAISRVQQVIQAARLISDLSNTETLDAFLANPHDRQAAYAWARHTAGIFDRAGALIPDDIPGIPSFICDYFKGLLSAPSNYVEVFIAIQEDHLADIDSATGGEAYDSRVTDGNTTLWAGPLSRLYNSCPQGLRTFMEGHREISGFDLWEASPRMAKALMLSALQSAPLTDFPGGSTREQVANRDRYIQLIEDAY